MTMARQRSCSPCRDESSLRRYPWSPRRFPLDSVATLPRLPSTPSSFARRRGLGGSEPSLFMNRRTFLHSFRPRRRLAPAPRLGQIRHRLRRNGSRARRRQKEARRRRAQRRHQEGRDLRRRAHRPLPQPVHHHPRGQGGKHRQHRELRRGRARHRRRRVGLLRHRPAHARIHRPRGRGSRRHRQGQRRSCRNRPSNSPRKRVSAR